MAYDWCAMFLGLAAVLLSDIIQAAPLESSRISTKAWDENQGMSPQVLTRIRHKAAVLRRKIASNKGVLLGPKAADNEILGDIMLTEGQLNHVLQEISDRGRSGGRHTRGLTSYFRQFMWRDSSILYAFDGSHDDAAMSQIRTALEEWQRNTCLLFREVQSATGLAEHHILFIADKSKGCWSYLGNVGRQVSPQPLNLPPGCMSHGKILHEVGHAIGLDHEHTRDDRDLYVEIVTDNIAPATLANFDIRVFGDHMDLPYNYVSVMHYASWAFALDRSKYTIRTQDPVYQRSLGQKTQLSYLDIKLVNLGYCSDPTCSLECHNGGYPEPNSNCQRCKCPDGLGGDTCQESQDSSPGCYPGTQGDALVAAEGEDCLETPYYGQGGYYPGDSCSWVIKAPESRTVDLAFRGAFGVRCRHPGTDRASCIDWVELKYGQNQDIGPRLCCDEPPSLGDQDVRSPGQSMITVVFRSPASSATARHPGFRLCYKLRPSTETTDLADLVMTSPTPEEQAFAKEFVIEDSATTWMADESSTTWTERELAATWATDESDPTSTTAYTASA